MNCELLLDIPSTTLSVGWMVMCGALMAIVAVMMFYPRTPACVVAYMAMWSGHLSGYTPFSTGDFVFWGIATVIVLANNRMLPGFVSRSRRGLGYIAGGALAGMAVGLTFYRPASVIIGSAFGAVIGAIAYARTGRGAVLDFPHAKFFNYLGAKGIPATVAASMTGLIIARLIVFSMLSQAS